MGISLQLYNALDFVRAFVCIALYNIYYYYFVTRLSLPPKGFASCKTDKIYGHQWVHSRADFNLAKSLLRTYYIACAANALLRPFFRLLLETGTFLNAVFFFDNSTDFKFVDVFSAVMLFTSKNRIGLFLSRNFDGRFFKFLPTTADKII